MLPNPNKKYKFKLTRRSSFIVDLKKLFTLLCSCCSIDTAGCAVSAPDKFGNSCESEWGSVATMPAGWSCTICRSAFFNRSIRFSGIIEYLLNSKVCRKKFEFVFQVGRKNVEPSLLAGYSYVCDLETVTSWRVILFFIFLHSCQLSWQK